MAIRLIDKILPKNDAFVGMVDAEQVLGGAIGGVLPVAAISSTGVNQHEAYIDHDNLLNTHNLTSDINHTSIGSVGSNTHLQIDAHISSTSNPHEVTAAQVGNDTAQWNADKIQDVDVTAVSPSDGDILVYRTASTAYVFEAKPAASGNPSWGDIEGTLSNQTDLQTALDAKVASTNYNTHVGSSSIHFTEASIDHRSISSVGSNTHLEIDTHVSSSAIHFVEGDIDHTAISNIGTNSHSDIDTHIASSSIHVGTADISHLEIQDIGSNTHAQLDTHVASSAIHFTEASIDHTSIQNIGSNSHSEIDTHISSSAIHFVESSIDHRSIGSVGSYTHLEIDSHIDDTDNPHSVTAEQIGNVNRLGNSTTYILVTPESSKIEMYVDGSKVQEWS